MYEIKQQFTFNSDPNSDPIKLPNSGQLKVAHLLPNCMSSESGRIVRILVHILSWASTSSPYNAGLHEMLAKAWLKYFLRLLLVTNLPVMHYSVVRYKFFNSSSVIKVEEKENNKYSEYMN